MTESKSDSRSMRESVIAEAVRILKKLDCSESVERETMAIIDRAEEQGLLSKGKPKSLAAGIIYIAGILCEDRMTASSIGGVAGVSASVVSNTYMRIARGLGYGER